MYSTYWYTITLPWKFYVVSEHVILYWMCCRNIFVLIKIIFFKIYISFIFKKFCRRLNEHVNICGHVLIMYGTCMWNSCIFTQFCLCMYGLVSFQLINFRYMCTKNTFVHLQVRYVRRDLIFFFNIILLEKLLLQKNILYIYFMDIIFSYTLI